MNAGWTITNFGVLKRPWESISMEFITHMSTLQGYTGIVVIVDIFSKYSIFIPMKIPCVMEKVVKLFKNVVKYWGLSLSIVLDMDTRFTKRFEHSCLILLGPSY